MAGGTPSSPDDEGCLGLQRPRIVTSSDLQSAKRAFFGLG